MDRIVKKIGISENTISLVLGVLVVIVLAVLAYNLFRVKPTTPAATTENQIKQQEQTNENGELTTPLATVALPIEHTIGAGENLWSIAVRYYNSGYNWVDIATVNGIVNPDKIYVGQKITIPNVAVRVPTVSASVVNTQVTLSRIEGGTYMTMKGDSLWTIAVRAYGDGFRYGDIAKANNITNPRMIYSGNVLIIPRP